MLRAGRRPDERDERGLTLVELLVAMGVFSVIMAVVTAGVVSALRTVRAADVASERQAEQQNAIVWISRLLRYADNPSEGYQSVPWVLAGKATTGAQGNADLTFTTYSGTGPKDRVAYLARLRVDADGNLVSEVTLPQTVSGYAYQCWMPTDAPNCAGITADTSTRVLVRATKESRPTLRIDYLDSAGAALPPPTAAQYPTNFTDVWRAWASKVARVVVTIGDSGGARGVSQLVNLANPR